VKAWKILIAFLLIMVLPVSAFATTTEEETTPDIVKLEELLEIAVSAEKSNYTNESWKVLESAIAAANNAIADGDQSRVNNAVTLLARALSQLTSMDYSKLDPIVQEAEQYIHGTYENWLTLFELLMNYQNLYGCGDQAAVDQAAAEIKSCLETLQGKVAPPQTEPPVSPEPVQPKQKSPVVWIVLLIVSLMGNVVLTAFLLLPKEGNKEEQVDDVPLVDYDIDDDVV